ncbi:type 2 periplasmic-binding domain-containing protein [Dongshaea marina]|uniref:hypothetical protein n=1 Tax=Dongshaea marina TaxID=2047966 RepID=UPI000D3E6D9B|nr:hypothetical protein [Dongshaea marina]
MNLSKVLLILLCVSCPLQAKTITFCYDGYPQSTLLPVEHASTLAPEKLLPLLIMAAGQKAGLRVNFQRNSQAQCERGIRSGRYDGMFAMRWTAQRARWLAYPKDSQGHLDTARYLWRIRYLIYVPNDSSVTWNGHRFHGIRKGLDAPDNFMSERRLGALGVLTNYKRESSDQEIMRVIKGQLDGFVLQKSTGEEMIRRLGLGDSLRPLAKPLIQMDLYAPLSKSFVASHPKSAQNFWNALAYLRDNQACYYQLVMR